MHSGRPSLTPASATRKSHARANSRPPPVAIPVKHARVGTPKSSMARKIFCMFCAKWRSLSGPSVPCIARPMKAISAPAEKNRPLAVPVASRGGAGADRTPPQPKRRWPKRALGYYAALTRIDAVGAAAHQHQQDAAPRGRGRGPSLAGRAVPGHARTGRCAPFRDGLGRLHFPFRSGQFRSGSLRAVLGRAIPVYSGLLRAGPFRFGRFHSGPGRAERT